MDDRCLAIVFRHVGFQPRDQAVDVLVPLDLAGDILFGPAGCLALEIVARLAVVPETDNFHIDGMKRRQRAVHGVIDAAPRIGIHFGQCRVPEDASVQMLHDEERPANRGIVFRQREHFWHRHVGSGQRFHHPVFPVHRMSGFQQFARRFGAQHVGAAGGVDPVGRVRLAIAVFVQPPKTGQPGHIGFKPRTEDCFVEGVGVAHLAAIAFSTILVTWSLPDIISRASLISDSLSQCAAIPSGVRSSSGR